MRTRTTALVAALAGALFAGVACNRDDDRIRQAANRAYSQNNLKQIGLALHAFESANGFFPAGIHGPDGKSLGLSWRVAILPYIEQIELYRQFKLNEPWDSDHNKALISRMPKTYAAPTGKGEAGQTFYRAFAGKGTWMPAPGSGQPGTPASGLRIPDIKDGLSNTVVVAEAEEPVIWTKPDELTFDPSGPLPNLGGLFPEGANALFADGSVHFLPTNTPPETLKALITIDGGEKVTPP